MFPGAHPAHVVPTTHCHDYKTVVKLSDATSAFRATMFSSCWTGIWVIGRQATGLQELCFGTDNFRSASSDISLIMDRSVLRRIARTVTLLYVSLPHIGCLACPLANILSPPSPPFPLDMFFELRLRVPACHHGQACIAGSSDARANRPIPWQMALLPLHGHAGAVLRTLLLV